jgi:hypothetical protein
MRHVRQGILRSLIQTFFEKKEHLFAGVNPTAVYKDSDASSAHLTQAENLLLFPRVPFCPFAETEGRILVSSSEVLLSAAHRSAHVTPTGSSCPTHPQTSCRPLWKGPRPWPTGFLAFLFDSRKCPSGSTCGSASFSGKSHSSLIFVQSRLGSRRPGPERRWGTCRWPLAPGCQ